MPTISVILPVHNASKFLLDALNSISSQTVNDWELIAIDDGSTDNSLQILREYEKKEPRLKIITRENKGLPTTLNEGIEKAQGQFIARMDADDICLPNRFEQQLKFLVKNNLDFCGSQILKFGNETDKSHYPTKVENCKFQLLFGNAYAHPTVLAKTSVFKKFRYDETLSYAQDYELWTRMALNNVSMNNTQDILLNYRCNDGQISNAKLGKQIEYAISIAKNYWLKNSLTRDLDYPIDVIDKLDNQEKKIYESLKTLLEFKYRITDNNDYISMIEIEQKKLYHRASVFGLRKLLPILKHDKNLKFSKKMSLAIIALLGFYHFKPTIKKFLSKENISFIRENIFYK